jgi:UDP-sugar transporter A1/2/3
MNPEFGSGTTPRSSISIPSALTASPQHPRVRTLSGFAEKLKLVATERELRAEEEGNAHEVELDDIVNNDDSDGDGEQRALVPEQTPAPAGASWKMQLLCMALLLAQNVAYGLTLRYARGIRKETWSLSIMLMWAEVTKCSISTIAMIATRDFHFTELIRTSLPLSVPAFLYFVQNLIGVFAYKSVAVAEASVLAQMKILSSAIFAVIFLKRQLSGAKWRALGHLILGAILIVYHKQQPTPTTVVVQEVSRQQHLIGVACLLCAYTLSGVNGVYVEKVLKKKKPQNPEDAQLRQQKQASIWVRNFQLSFFSIIFAVLSSLFVQRDEWSFEELSLRSSVTAWSAVLIGAVGGILVALVLRYANVILKCFVSTVAVIVLTICSVFLFNHQVDVYFAIGVCVILLSTFNYILK